MEYKDFFKRVVITAILVVISNIAFAEITHIVERGETIEDVAKKYNVSVEDIKKANPDMGSVFFSGMKLKIPDASGVQVEQNNDSVDEDTADNVAFNAEKVQPKANTVAQTDQLSVSPYNTLFINPGWDYVFMAEYGFLPKMEGVSNYNYALGFTAGANYWVFDRQDKLFAGARIGYNYSCFDISEGSASIETNYHMITLPVSLGWSFADQSKKYAFTPMTAFDFNLTVSAKGKVKSGYANMSPKIDAGKLGVGLKLGAAIRIYEWDLMAFYTFSLNDEQKRMFGKDGYFSVALGFGF